MGEYQYHEFRVIDSTLTAKDKEEISKLYSRFKPTTRTSTLIYKYGDFPGDSIQALTKYFDIMYYIANWGTQQLAFRFPKSLISAKAIAPYCLEDCIELSFTKEWAILNWQFHQEEGFNFWIEGEGRLEKLVELRQEILDQDYRSLYLAWLKGITRDEEYGEIDPAQPEPPIPNGLQQLSTAQQAFVSLFEIDPHLVTAAAKISPALTPTSDNSLAIAISQLSREDCDQFLLRLIQGERNLANKLKQKLAESFSESSLVNQPQLREPQRTVHDLLQGKELAEKAWQQQELEKAQKQRIKDMEALAPKAMTIWVEVDRLLLETKSQNYDQAVKYLLQLQDLAEYQKQTAIFQQKMQAIAQKYPNRKGLIQRFQTNKLLS